MLASVQSQFKEVIAENISAEGTNRIVRKPEFVSVVAYIHNDCDKIQKFIEVVMGFFQQNFKKCEVIFVDDYSSDESLRVIKEYYKNNPVDYVVSIVRMGCYHGMEIAMNAGRDMSIGDYVYEFDNLYIDYDPDVIMAAYDKCMEGYDIVMVSTDVPVRATSKLFYKLFNCATNLQAKIGQDSWRLISRRGINRVTSMDVNIPYRKAVYLNCGLSVAQISYKSATGVRPPRITRKYERFNLGIESFIYFTNIIERIGMVVASLIAIFCVVSALSSVILGLFGKAANSGFSLLMIVVCVGFIGMFCLIAVVLKYLSVLVDLAFKRQKYRIADVDKISSR